MHTQTRQLCTQLQGHMSVGTQTLPCGGLVWPALIGRPGEHCRSGASWGEGRLDERRLKFSSILSTSSCVLLDIFAFSHCSWGSQARILKWFAIPFSTGPHFVKKVRDTKGTFHAKIDTIKDTDGMDLTEAEGIKKRQQEYTEKLYKKGFTTQSWWRDHI